MGIIINIDGAAEKMQPGLKITFDSLNFIADWFGDLHLRELEPPVEEKEQPPLICAFFAGLEEPIDVGPRALAQHLNRNGHNVFIEIIQEHDFDVII